VQRATNGDDAGAHAIEAVNSHTFVRRRRHRSRTNAGVNSTMGAVEVFDLSWLDEGGAAERSFAASMEQAIEESTLDALKALPECMWGGQEFECALCLDAVHSGMRVRTLCCGHRFHSKCIDEWLCITQARKERRCPLCNADPISGAQILQDGSRRSSASPPPAPLPLPRTPHGTSLALFGGVPVEHLLPRWAIQEALLGTPLSSERLAMRVATGRGAAATAPPEPNAARSSSDVGPNDRPSALALLLGSAPRPGVRHSGDRDREHGAHGSDGTPATTRRSWRTLVPMPDSSSGAALDGNGRIASASLMA
jgi:hypothetical protein